MQFSIPENVEYIIKQLNTAGYEAYAVGGCVRDMMIGRIPEDWDITTSAKPQEVKQLFRRTVDTGIQHGTVTIMIGKIGYEVTTYRIDGDYVDGRHPESVEFTSNLVEDLKRRDFTINAMAYNPKVGVVDEFGGVDDLDRKIIRCVGKPEERFGEDALRILRAVRFSAQLGFEVDKDTKNAISKIAPNLVNISKERIQVELDKLLKSDYPEKILMCNETGISRYIMPWFKEMEGISQNTKYHTYDLMEHTIRVVKAVRPNHYLRWAALLHDVAKVKCKTTDHNGTEHFYNHTSVGADMSKKILRGLKFDNVTIDYVSRLVKYHDLRPDNTVEAVRRCIYKIGEELFPYYLELRSADCSAKSEYAKQRDSDNIDFTKKAYEQIMANNDCLSLKNMAIKGSDIIEMGVKPGPEIGTILEYILDKVIDDPTLNNIDKLKNIANDFINVI